METDFAPRELVLIKEKMGSVAENESRLPTERKEADRIKEKIENQLTK